jgi:hypothetical protein
MKVTSRDLICGPLPALKDNREEAEQRELRLRAAEDEAAAAAYRPGRYVAMDWVASRLHKAGAAVWAFISTCEAFAAMDSVELDWLSGVSGYLA